MVKKVKKTVKKVAKKSRKKEELSKYLLEVICCPVDKSDLKYSKSKNTLTCIKCKHVYKIKEGIPILLPPELEEE